MVCISVSVEPEGLLHAVRQVGVGEEELGGEGFEERLRSVRVGEVDGALGGEHQGGVALAPGLGGFGEVGEDGAVVEVAPRLVDHHELHAGGLGRIVQGEA